MLANHAQRVIFDAWIVFLIVWAGAAITTKPRDRSAGQGRRFPLGVGLLVVLLLFGGRLAHTWLGIQVLRSPAWLVLLGSVITLAGIALAFWARIYLGRNWGPPATMRVGHELVTSGPYAYMRHPIYWGVCAAMVGTALAIGSLLMVLIACAMIVRFWWAARTENALLVRQFGAQAKHR
jgi:protein-S-isoprenylcysteine O-methyltransferase Ste14